MSRLKPGVAYIYERALGVIYARESGSDPSTRFVVGYESGANHDPITGHKIDKNLWDDIFIEAESNPALQTAIDRVIMIYRLSKDNPQ